MNYHKTICATGSFLRRCGLGSRGRFLAESIGGNGLARKCVSVFLVLMLSGLAAPAFAGDDMNMKLLPQSLPLAPASWMALPPVTSLREMPGALAFALPQSVQPQATPANQPQTPPASQPQPQPTKPNAGQSTSGAMKWGGIALMLGGGALVGRGASITDPCSGLSGPGVLCTSNYQTVRAASLALGGVAIVVGAVLFLHRHHH
jgi:hypothetical protein